MKKIIFMFLAMLMIFMTGCEVSQNSDDQQRYQQEKILQEGVRQSGMPDIVNFYEKKQLKKILEMRDNPKLITYSYTKNVNGKYIFLGKSIGYGIPYATQYTSPDKIDGGGTPGYVTVAQADPNGLFSPDSANATWVMLLDEQGEISAIYVEDNLTVTQKPLRKAIVEPWSIEGIEY